MTDRKLSRKEEQAYAELNPALRTLLAMNTLMTVEYEKLKYDMIPTGWNSLEDDVPTRPKQVRINATYDADVARFFRAMGNGYQARMNAVLRAYMLGVMSRAVRSKKNEDWLGKEI